jgi:hypothetical protein
MVDRDDLLWIDKVARITAVVVGILALPLIIVVSIMASDAPGSAAHATRLSALWLGSDLAGMACALVPAVRPPVTGKRLALFVLLRLPAYGLAIAGVGGFLWMLGRALVR